MTLYHCRPTDFTNAIQNKIHRPLVFACLRLSLLAFACLHPVRGGATRAFLALGVWWSVLEALAALPLSTPRDSQSIGHVYTQSLIGSHILSYRYGLLRQSG